MKFSNASYFFFFCASAVSALRYGDRIDTRNVDVPQFEALDKRVAASEAGFDVDTMLDAREEAQPAAAGTDSLLRRDIVSDAEKEILQYLRNIVTSGPSGINGPASWPSQWSDLHGDKKSDFKGYYVCQVMKDKSNKYRARVVEHDAQKGIKKGHVFKTVDVPVCKDKKGKELVPSYGRAIHFLRKAFGGENPPACG
ncbi:uncharacterized protein PG998_000086 [Apiospora kogelbergensis]|uniref:uncharacterized protein n=1 Tax=Apiospora kogelbergensis TaxID=1337665 RepID=UPI00312F4D44